MNEKLREIADQINYLSVKTDSVLNATVSDDGSNVKIENNNNPDVEIVLIATENQLLSITPLFSVASVTPSRVAELDRALLAISLPMVLSSVSIQNDDRYVLFGSMAINTTIENLMYELEVQASNYDELMAALAEFIVEA
ncbi:MAG: hypothetical protein ACI9WC_003043 [Arenicella sp.]|jgi:uncharacterized protein YjfI (DUF2170 family)